MALSRSASPFPAFVLRWGVVEDDGAHGSNERRRAEVPAAAGGRREGEEHAAETGRRRLRRRGTGNRGRRRRRCGPAQKLGDGGVSEVACRERQWRWRHQRGSQRRR
jgi:hypothetical protein